MRKIEQGGVLGPEKGPLSPEKQATYFIESQKKWLKAFDEELDRKKDELDKEWKGMSREQQNMALFSPWGGLIEERFETRAGVPVLNFDDLPPEVKAAVKKQLQGDESELGKFLFEEIEKGSQAHDEYKDEPEDQGESA